MLELKVSAAWLWLLAAGLILAREGVQGRDGGRITTATVAAVVVMQLFVLGSWLASPFKDAGDLRGSLFYLGVMAAAAGLAMPRIWIQPQLDGILWAAFGVALYALAQRLGWDPIEAYRLAGSGTRAVGSFGNATLLAAFLCLVWPLALRLPIRARWAALLLLFAAMAATRSRSGLLAVGAQGAILGALTWIEGWRPRLAWLGALGVMALVLALYFPWSEWARPTLRWPLWQESLGLWLQHPWFGWGPGSFPLAYQTLQGSLGAGLGSGQYVDHPHNWVIAALCETGLFGLASLAAFFGIPLWRHYSKAPWRASQEDLLGLGLLGLLIQALFDRSLQQTGLWTLACAFLGFLAGSIVWSGRRYPGRAIGWIFGMLALVALFNIGGPIQAWRLAVHALPSALEQAGDVADRTHRVELAPGDPVGWENLGLALAARNRFDESKRAFEQAWRIRPSVSVVINLGNCAMMAQDFTKAENSFRKATWMDPQSTDAHFGLGYACFQQKKLKEAVTELDLALKLDPANANAAKLKEQILR